MLFGEDSQRTFKVENTLRILDRKNKTYLFSLGTRWGESMFSYNSEKIFSMIDFFDYKLSDISNYSGFTILPKNNSEKEKFTYHLETKHEINKYGLEKIWFLIGGFIFYFVIFLYCFFENYISTGPETNFPTLIVIISLIISLFALIPLIKGIYKRFKRKTLFPGIGNRMIIKFSGELKDSSSLYFDNSIDEISESKNKHLISIEIKDIKLTFEGVLQLVKAEYLWDDNPAGSCIYMIYTIDKSFEKWWKDNFGSAGMEKNNETSLCCYNISKEFYNKFGIYPVPSDYAGFQYERFLCSYFYINKQ